MSNSRLSRRFFRREPTQLAKSLLGQILVRQTDQGERLAGQIIETEAYLGLDDKAAHTYNGHHTKRNHSMFLDGGHAYVYFTYGMHYCLNVVSDRDDVPTACLIRALKPVEGIEQMKQNRSGKIEFKRLTDRDLCSGPAKLCQALAIDRAIDGIDLTTSNHLWLEKGKVIPEAEIVCAKRVGIAYAKEWANQLLRFYIADSRYVSVRYRDTIL